MSKYVTQYKHKRRNRNADFYLVIMLIILAFVGGVLLQNHLKM